MEQLYKHTDMNTLPKPPMRIAADVEAAQQRLAQIDERLPKEYRDALEQLDNLKDGIDIIMEHAEAIAKAMPRLDEEQRKHRQNQFMRLMKAHTSGHSLILIMQQLYAELHLMKKTRVDQINQSLRFQRELAEAHREIAELNKKVIDLQEKVINS